MLKVHINLTLPQDFRADLEAEIKKLTSITYRKRITQTDNLYIFYSKNPIEFVQLGILIAKYHHKLEQLTITV